jgi:hypothetical protein
MKVSVGGPRFSRQTWNARRGFCKPDLRLGQGRLAERINAGHERTPGTAKRYFSEENGHA